MEKYRYIIYNCGYYQGKRFQGKITGRKYKFIKRMVTEVDPKDGKAFCEMTSNDIEWCDTNDKKIPPFMTAKDWCECKEGTFTIKGGHFYNYKEYVKSMLVTE